MRFSTTPKTMRKFDWHKDKITISTEIDVGYKNTQNVRRFLKAHGGDHFKFDRSFMLWMKTHQGMTMGDALAEWFTRKKDKNFEGNDSQHCGDGENT